MNRGVNDDPRDKEAREISHESFFDYLVDASKSFVIDSEG